MSGSRSNERDANASESSDELSLSSASAEVAEQHLADESVEVIQATSETVQILPSNGDPSVLDNDDQANATGPFTRRLRCLFSTVTWPIVPLGSFVSLALLWVLYAAFVLDLRRSCSHPLHWYAFASLLLVSYAPQHAQVRSLLFRYNRERDGPIRPRRVRIYDQLFHTLCLLYVYGGVNLLQTCRDDEIKAQDGGDLKNIGPAEQPENTCVATCPNLYQAMSVYVTTLEMFTFALILPLLFLPCLYLWILRRATEEMDAFAQLHDRLDEEEALLAGEGVTAQELMDSLESVRLVYRRKLTEFDSDASERAILLVHSNLDNEVGAEQDGSHVKECCICMTEFEVQADGDIENGFESDIGYGTFLANESPAANAELMVRTKCGHVFHRRCLAGWVGGRWEATRQSGDSDTIRRRARRTCCPLCREDLKPAQNDYQAT